MSVSQHTTPENAYVLMTPERVNRAVKRMAFQIAESTDAGKLPLIIGIADRGLALAGKLSAELQLPLGSVCELLSVKVKGVGTVALDYSSVEGRDILLVDDVLFSGRTVAAALNAILDKGNPSRIRIVALVDRGHRQFPFFAEFFGIKLPTKFREHVQVSFLDETDSFTVYLHQY
ncbi:MAG: hypothetical protein LAT67_09590 [Balneolales bacterium]|nr:hypothetical protein [Balneolales bacterium]